jgi:dCTP deaminase
MSIYSDREIIKKMKKGKIVIKPFDKNALGSNSYDVHLGEHIATYKDKILDAAKHNTIILKKIPKNGIILKPGVLYLAATQEYTETFGAVPFLDGKSSTGRLGIQIHLTAGKGDAGFKGYWTLEITVPQAVRVYAGMPIGQIFYHTLKGKVKNSYDKKKGAKYSNQPGTPVESMMWRNDFFTKIRESKK